MTTAFASFLGASQRGARPRRRRLLVLGSALAHLGLLVLAATVGIRPAPAAAPPPEPILVRLSAPPRRGSSTPPAAAPRNARSAPRPRLTQPVQVLVAPPVEAPPVEEVEPAAEGEMTEEPAGLPTGDPAAPPAAEALFEVREVARPPSVTARVTPDYPREARRDRVEGTVVLRVIVGADGAVERSNTRVVRSVPALDAAAIAAIEGWRFLPAIGHSGRPVRVVIEVPFQFYLR